MPLHMERISATTANGTATPQAWVPEERSYYWIATAREEDAHLTQGQTRWFPLRTSEPPVSNRAFEARVGNATTVMKLGFGPEVLTDMVRAVE